MDKNKIDNPNLVGPDEQVRTSSHPRTLLSYGHATGRPSMARAGHGRGLTGLSPSAPWGNRDGSNDDCDGMAANTPRCRV